VIRRLIILIFVGWLLGFAGFASTLPSPAPQTPTDAIVVLTGGTGRTQQGLSLLAAGLGKRLLISGVESSVGPHQFALAQKVPERLVRCCVDLGKKAFDTTTNAQETADWVKARNYRSIRLVTNDWHMPRARFEAQRVIGADVKVVPDAVKSDIGLFELFTEYNKYLLRRAAVLLGA
jgi:uncharacterized SAM-binding protein YcdF (DUF218 family)